ncbi:MAG: adenylyl-sulfate kinase [Muribaculaceae bacterium]|nr:adenylyl-sulfate kinase [Roseburia sp.]MCM1429863.1 adenylyl-sulfate kinase [Muribaculaceae bacterium]MCM1492914.1 adenylyl-sulfate kinase [Muribaculaceae bacterium]
MKDLLKFVTCGSVDDGKSTLIGHMLYDAKLLFTDQEQALELESRVGSRGGEIDYSLLLDGLMAEREQGITIDVAYRYFATERRSFIVADTPGHEEYTRNMAVGASFADLAVILVDASQGIFTQTRRHARICALMGISHFCFVVNKMDLLQYRQSEYRKIETEIRKLAVDLELQNLTIIPVSATEGDNITDHSGRMPWYQGKTLLCYLEEVDAVADTEKQEFVMPIQRVCRPDYTFRGFQGQIESGIIHKGDEVTVLPSREKALVKEVIRTDTVVQEAQEGDAVTIRLDREVDVSRGCVLTKDTNLQVGNLFLAQILWMDDGELAQGKSYLLKLGTRLIPVSVMKIKYRIDINSGEKIAVTKLYKNEIAVCEMATSQRIVFDLFRNCRALGSFILMDRITNMTSACGVILHSLRRSDNLVWQKMDITRKLRAERMNQKPMTLWFTGLSGSGKSTIANALEKRLCEEGKFTMLLDGDNVRMGLNRNLGFEPEDRIENIRRIAEVSKLMNDAGLIVLTAFISPYESDRQNARDIIGKECFVEIYVDTSLEVCEKRDVKGLYQKARRKEIPNFTGISSPYEVPGNPDITVSTENKSVEECVDLILEHVFGHI